MSNHPKVFISHASEDKERFVVKFAERLRYDGIEAWLDKWEILLGDSLVQKIFDEGLEQSDIIAIVISKYSITKKWVKEELDLAVYRKIEGKCRIIPIIIDDCIVPESIKHTLHVKIQNLNNYDAEYNEIRSTIFGETKKPPLGELPQYLTAVQMHIDKFTHTDNYIAGIICEKALEDDYPFFVTPTQILPIVSGNGITEDEFYDTIEIMDGRGYIEAEQCYGGEIPAIKISTLLLEKYCRQCIDDYDNKVVSVISAIVNENKLENSEIAAESGIKQSIVSHILIYLDNIGKIKTTTAHEGVVLVHPNNMAELKRLLR
ncbi:toll/interleukin-1 receptor domain-containing protein [Methanogenium sp. S4BF]|uniref:toll/interleukin-1 receptor domain-containing protein n=1 Tax=Methanogenium sp. S4BF TaxID=1789226 RepID=UPI0024163950|nr:toll/interleukin-1 receptor domain-containing protein [Methanogenium sp. S4BF]WFN35240.1 toll/interleukin-1 receptor domain-containing protein [Methanogenium sp. S4BF]